MRRQDVGLRLAMMTSILALGGCEAKDVQKVSAADTLDAGAPTVQAAGAPAPATAGEAVEYYTAAALAHVGDSLARGSSTGHMLRGHPTYQYLQIRRGRSGVPEVHDRWIDITMVQAGRATLLSGGSVSGSHVETPGEHRGGTIAGGSTRAVGPGDLMIIQAGVPHQYQLAPGDSLRYLTVKVLDARTPR
jgi:hypothetical protein